MMTGHYTERFIIRIPWVPPPCGYVPVGEYSSPQFPLNRKGLPDGQVCVDELRENGKLIAVKLHDDCDDPNHTFLDADAWHLWPNKKRLAAMHGLPFRRSMRLAAVRQNRPNNGLERARANYCLAVGCLELQKTILARPDEPVDDFQCGWAYYPETLAWSPSGQVWRNGQRWVKIRP